MASLAGFSELRPASFNLGATIESGQLFRYDVDGEGSYTVVVGDLMLRVRQKATGVIEYSCSDNDFDVKRFLGLRQDYARMAGAIGKDEKISAAVLRHRGLRILEQDLWECTASFICSSFSNIPRIRQCVSKVASTFGEAREFDGVSYFSFPQPSRVGNLSRLKKCGLGYRAQYLFETARMFAGSSEYSGQKLRRLGYARAKQKLMELSGVGSKVADCILLFSCGFLESFPVDVWIRRVMEGLYGPELKSFSQSKGKAVSEALVGEFAREHFGKYAGYAQQFLYHDARSARIKSKPLNTRVFSIGLLVNASNATLPQ